MVFSADDRLIDVVVVALVKADGQHAFSRAEFILPHVALAGHLDTVRTENDPARIDGGRCFGAGSIG